MFSINLAISLKVLKYEPTVVSVSNGTIIIISYPH